MIKILFLALFVFCIVSCGTNNIDLTKNEPVLSDGLKIVVSTSSETVLIEGLKGNKRRYSGKGWSKTSALTLRTTRWYGSLGLYDPADSYSLSDRLLLDEGRQFFSSESEVLRFINKLSKYYGVINYKNNGLLVAYKVIPIEGGAPTRSLEVWQIYINGVKPTSLRGANDSKIEITGGSIQEKAVPIVAEVGYERELSNEEYVAPEY